MAMRIEPTIIPKICGMMMTNPSVSCWIESRATRKKIVLAAAISRPIAMIVFAVRHISLPSGISLSVISASLRPYGLFSADSISRGLTGAQTLLLFLVTQNE
jgi:hypothetical protein